MRTRLLGAVAMLAAPAVALSTALAAPVAQAAPAKAAKVDCQVHAVLASKEEGSGVPAELSFLSEQLADDEFAAYKSYYLVEAKKMSMRLSEAGSAAFKSGHKLSLSLLGNKDQRLELKLDLLGRDGKKQLMSTRYSINSGGVLMIRAGSDEFTHDGHKGKLFFATQCVLAK